VIQRIKQLFSWRRVRLILVYVLIIFVSSFIGNIWMTRDQASGQLSSVVFKDIQGADFNLEFNRVDNSAPASTQVLSDNPDLQDKPVLLYFFADWCPICKVQHSVISSISPNARVLGVAMQSGDDENVRKYVAKQGIDFKVINDENGAISRSLGVNGVPAAFIIDNTGQITFSTRGYTSTIGMLSRIWLTHIQ